LPIGEPAQHSRASRVARVRGQRSALTQGLRRRPRLHTGNRADLLTARALQSVAPVETRKQQVGAVLLVVWLGAVALLGGLLPLLLLDGGPAICGK